MAKKQVKKNVTLSKKEQKIQQKKDQEQKKQNEEENNKNIASRRSSRNQNKDQIEEEPSLKRKAKVQIQDDQTKKSKKTNKQQEEQKKNKEEEEQKMKQDDKEKNQNKKIKKNKDEEKSTQKEDEESEDEQKLVTNITKGGYAVDQHCPNKDKYHVLVTSSQAFDVTLNQTNCGANNNKFMHLQVLQADNGGAFYFFSRWGRVGQVGQQQLSSGISQQSAIAKFNSKLYDKTVKGNYTQIKIVMDEDPQVKEQKEKEKEEKMKSDSNKSKLPVPVKELIKLIFDMNMMNQQMKEIGYDAKKLPLGKLSPETIKEGYSHLNNLSKELKKKNINKNLLMEYSNQFYSTIPHDFGFQKMSNFIIDTLQKVTDKINLLSSLENIQIATKLLDSSEQEDISNQLDSNYQKLNSELTPLVKTDSKYKLIEEYMTNSHAKTHSNYTLDIMDIFEVYREQDEKRFTQQINNKQLLWHGSRLTNYVGILSQGLRIAPPEAPVTGYMFGKGVYFADMVSKSANYCFTNKQNNIGLLMLCEVALGTPNPLKHSCYTADQLPKGTHSTHGLGRTMPDPNGTKQLGDVLVPCGKGIQGNAQGLSLLYNEFIVYDVAQIKIKYLIKTKFNHKW